MKKTSIGSPGRRIAGSLKEAIGKVTGDTKLEAEGIAQVAAERGVEKPKSKSTKK